MKIYFAFSTREISKHLPVYNRIKKYLTENGHQLTANYAMRTLRGVNLKENHRINFEKEKSLMFNSDLILIEASSGSFELGAMFGHAINSKKHVLCIHNEVNKTEAITNVVKSYQSSLSTTYEYNNRNLDRILDKYFENFVQDAPIKFNFVANKDIVDFIEKGASEQGKSKSEFLRDLIRNQFMK